MVKIDLDNFNHMEDYAFLGKISLKNKINFFEIFIKFLEEEFSITLELEEKRKKDGKRFDLSLHHKKNNLKDLPDQIRVLLTFYQNQKENE